MDGVSDRDILAFFRKAIAFTKRYAVLQNRKFFLGQDLNNDTIADISWFGTDLGVPRWNDPEVRTLCYRLDGGETQSSLGTYYLFIILNADFNPQRVSLPPPQGKRRWYRAIDTSLKNGQDFLDFAAETPLDPQDVYLANPRSTVALVAR